jgi:hypothetical protein
MTDILQGRVFYKPAAGTYIGKIIDVVDKPGVTTQYGLKNKVLIVWTITQLDGTVVLDPENQPMQASAYVTMTMNEKSSQPLFRNLYKIVTGVIGGQPPLLTKFEQLEQLLGGRSNVLMITSEPNPQKAGDFYANVVGILPLSAGMKAPATPTGFVRAKNRPKTQAGPQGQPVQTYSVPPAQTNSAPVPAVNLDQQTEAF